MPMKNFVKFDQLGQRNYLPVFSKRILSLLFVVSFAFLAQASSYEYLVFTNIDGNKTAFQLNNLSMRINVDELEISSDDLSVNLVLAELVSMQFSNDNPTTGLVEIINADAPLEVFSVSGTLLGSYPSLIDVAHHLNAGVYLISNGSITQKIIVK